MIEVTNLVRQFGPIVAVNDVSFTVTRGEVLGFLGPNGAGKSTTMKMITGFLTPSAGRVSVMGADVVQSPLQAKRHIGYLPEGAPAYQDMTPRSFLSFVADIRGLSGPKKNQAIEDAVAKVAIDEVLEQPIETLSKGFKRRVGLAQAIMHDPPVLILDEPTDGLDPNQKHEVRDLIQAMAKDKAIIISTHILEEVEAVCSRAMIIARGKILADSTPDALQAQSHYYNVVTLATQHADAASAIESLESVAKVETVANGRYRIFPHNRQSIVKDVMSLANAHHWPVDEIHVDAGRLDEVFRQITVEQA